MVLAMFAAFVFFGLRVAMRCEDRFGSLLAGEYDVTAPGVSNSAYLGHEASFDQKASSYRSELFGKLGA